MWFLLPGGATSMILKRYINLSDFDTQGEFITECPVRGARLWFIYRGQASTVGPEGLGSHSTSLTKVNKPQECDPEGRSYFIP